ncbi:DUF3492 domain-containing protein [Deinococcus sp. SM5_A1]|uniref:DUF3492 domain-containing protein n=1 Tax=Deinococcus sp. SM5_A1 TaxID=3379094 RepID=UPI00385BD539
MPLFALPEVRQMFTHMPTQTIALYTEGTYPQAHGGVSVWVDQLVRGLDDHRFVV